MDEKKKSRKKIYEGTSKILYETEDEYTIVQFFKDDYMLKNGNKIEVAGKGAINNKISSHIMHSMDMACIDNHFIDKINMREQHIQLVDIIPITMCINNVANDRYVKEFGIERGYVFDVPMVEYRVKNRENNNPVINEYQIKNFCWINKDEMTLLREQALKVHSFLTGFFASRSIRLVSSRLEFGRVFDGERFTHMLADEITPENCQLWDAEDNSILDSTYIDDNLDNPIFPYNEIAKRLGL